MAIDKRPKNDSNAVRYAIIGVLALAAFFGAYKFASASSGAGQSQPVAQASVAAAGTGQTAANTPNAGASTTGAAGANASSSSAAGACACCGGGSSQPTANGVTGPQVDGTAAVSGGVQKIAVNVTTVYSPNVIHLKAGVPTEITFSSAQGCTAQVQSQELGFVEDLSTGPKVVTLKAPAPGTYDFACGMDMVHGKIVVE